jgi:hypothetical protein
MTKITENKGPILRLFPNRPVRPFIARVTSPQRMSLDKLTLPPFRFYLHPSGGDSYGIDDEVLNDSTRFREQIIKGLVYSIDNYQHFLNPENELSEGPESYDFAMLVGWGEGFSGRNMDLYNYSGSDTWPGNSDVTFRSYHEGTPIPISEVKSCEEMLFALGKESDARRHTSLMNLGYQRAGFDQYLLNPPHLGEMQPLYEGFIEFKEKRSLDGLEQRLLAEL